MEVTDEIQAKIWFELVNSEKHNDFMSWLIANFDIKEKKMKNKDYTHEKSFWIRLYDFVSNVAVNDAMSEEEKDMIIHNCIEKLKTYKDFPKEDGNK